MPKIGVIDVGTNSVLTIGLDEQQQVFLNDYEISEFGRGLSTSENTLPEDAIKRTLEIVKRFVDQLRDGGAQEIRIIGTSASRDAVNIEDFSEPLLTETGISYEIISGEDEATYTYLGALSGYDELPAHPLMMMDIGGGSTEIIVGTGHDIEYRQSHEIGVLRTADQFHFPWTWSAQHRQTLQEHVVGLLPEDSSLKGHDTLIGIGGTVTQLAALELELKSYDPVAVNNVTLDMDALETLFRRINAANLATRPEMPGMEAKRSPVILYGLVICMAVMERYTISKMRVTNYGLCFGVAREMLAQI